MEPWRLSLLSLALCGSVWLIPVGTGLICPTEPFDAVVDVLIEEVEVDEALRAPAGHRTLVVLQHGLVRSPTSLKPLERALERHGYDVLNPGYPSLTTRIEEQAAMLDSAIDAHLEGRRTAGLPAYDRVAFVGHSMGGLVIRAYLERDDAVTPWACVFCGTPQRGATMADERSQEFVARTFFGRGNAPEQLLTTDPLYDRLGPVRAEHIGTIAGVAGDGEGFSAGIPGDDDRMVGVEEAQLPEQTGHVTLFMMHTWLAISPAAVHQVLHFLRTGAFDPDAKRTW